MNLFPVTNQTRFGWIYIILNCGEKQAPFTPSITLLSKVVYQRHLDRTIQYVQCKVRKI